MRSVEEAWDNMVLMIPNVPHETVPVGTGEEDNPVVKTWGEKPAFDFTPLAHWDLGEKLIFWTSRELPRSQGPGSPFTNPSARYWREH